MKNIKNEVMYVDEVFASIQGESTDAGLPCIFVRFFGCNIGCTYCDQMQPPSRKKRMTIDNLMKQVQQLKIKYVCITGGEPLLQWNSVYPIVLELVCAGYKVSIETSGCVPISPDPYDRSFKYVMDIKCPSSGVSHKNVYDNLMNLQAKDEVKFVIANRTDYDFMKKVLNQYSTPAKILVSPCFSKDLKPIIGEELIEWLIQDQLFNVRVQIQMHKILNVR